MFKNIDDLIYKLLFLVSLLLTTQVSSFEFVFATLILLTVYFLNRRNQKISGDFITVSLP